MYLPALNRGISVNPEMGIPRARNRKFRFVTRRSHDKDAPKSPRHRDVKMYAELERKICVKCKEQKPATAFSARNSRPIGKMSMCKECHNQWRREHKAKNPNRAKEYEFARGLKRFYGLTVEQYRQMLQSQNERCACCGKHQSEFKRRLHVDHDHATGQIRALLCTECNPGLGYFQHSVERLMEAVRYLEKFKN